MGVISGLTVGASAIENASNAIQIIGNNVANVGTTGFKRSRANFSEAFASSLPGGGAGDQIGNGANRIDPQRIVTQGPSFATGRELDLAIEGKGWFIVRGATDTFNSYTRSGVMSLDKNLTIVHSSGKKVQGFPIVGGVVQATTVSDITITGNASIGNPSTLADITGNLDSGVPILGTPPIFTSSSKSEEFLVVQGTNDQIAFEAGGSTPITASLITDGGLTSGAAVDGAALASALKQALEAKNGSSDTYDVTYDQSTDKFTIKNRNSNSTTIKFRHDLGTSNASGLLGFAAVESRTFLTNESEVSDFGVAFNVLTGLNDTLNATVEGSAVSITVAAGNYSGAGLAGAMERAFQSTSSIAQGTTVRYNQPGALSSFQVLGPLTGGAHTINQPSNTATPTINVAAKQIQVTGGTLAPTTALNTGTSTAGAGFFDINDPFTTSSGSTSFDLIDGLGEKHNMTIFFRKIGDNNWEWHGALKGKDLVGSTPDETFEEVVSGRLSYTSSWLLESESTTAGTGVFSFDAVGSGALPPGGQTVAFDFGTSIITDGGSGDDGTTQFDSNSLSNRQETTSADAFSFSSIITNGTEKGTFSGITVGNNGAVFSEFTNGKTILLAQIALATFPADDELTSVRDNLLVESNASGAAILVQPDIAGVGFISSKSLEGSNVELANEFGDLIFQQEVFKANARTVSVADEMLQALINAT